MAVTDVRSLKTPVTESLLSGRAQESKKGSWQRWSAAVDKHILSWELHLGITRGAVGVDQVHNPA